MPHTTRSISNSNNNNNSTSSTNPKTPPASSKNKFKSTLVLKPTKTLKPPLGVVAMLHDSGLDENASFEVQSQDPDPSLVTPSKSTSNDGLPMEVYNENGLLIVAYDDDSDSMEDMLSVDLQDVDSGIAEGSTGRNLASNATLLSVGTTQGFVVYQSD